MSVSLLFLRLNVSVGTALSLSPSLSLSLSLSLKLTLIGCVSESSSTPSEEEIERVESERGTVLSVICDVVIGVGAMFVVVAIVVAVGNTGTEFVV